MLFVQFVKWIFCERKREDKKKVLHEYMYEMNIYIYAYKYISFFVAFIFLSECIFCLSTHIQNYYHFVDFAWNPEWERKKNNKKRKVEKRNQTQERKNERRRRRRTIYSYHNNVSSIWLAVEKASRNIIYI